MQERTTTTLLGVANSKVRRGPEGSRGSDAVLQFRKAGPPTVCTALAQASGGGQWVARPSDIPGETANLDFM